MQNNRAFHDALPGHFIQYGDLAEERIEYLLEKTQTIADMSENY